jgi:hypothetical protein
MKEGECGRKREVGWLMEAGRENIENAEREICDED